MRLIVFTLVLGFMLPLSARAEANKGYLGFAAKVERGPSSVSTCRSYGGQPVFGRHHNVVMSMGRYDNKRSNIIYYGGHRFVTFTVENTNFWGRTDTAILLCHFAG